MSGYVPKRVSNARMRTKTNQTGLKMQGSASTLGRRGYIQRYVNRRVQTGFGVDGYPTGYRCINGIDPQTASLKALECNCYYARDVRINQVVLAPQPKNQSLAGGVGRINAPRFSCGDSCAALNTPGDANHHPHFHPPIIPHIKPEPIPGEVPPFSVTMQHYGIASEEFENNLSFANPQVIGPGTSSDDWTRWTSEFKQYATSYLNFIQKLQNTTPKDAKKPIYVDRVMFNINGNPGPGKAIESVVKATPYSLLINPDTGVKMDGSSSGIYDYPMIYKHFVKPFIKNNFDGTFKNKVQLGFTFDMSSPWNAFLNAIDGNERLEFNTTVSSNNFSSNNSGIVSKDDQTLNGAVNQTFRYIGAINDLILADPELATIRNNNESLLWLVSSASYDNEGNSSLYPSTEIIATNMWELQVAGAGGSPTYSTVHPELANIPPNYSSTGDMGYGNNNITLDNVGPDRIYQEIYDLDPTAAKCSSSYPNDAHCCDYHFGSISVGQIGWGVKITQNVPGKDPNPPTFGARNCPTNNNTPNYKGTLRTDSTNSKYFTLAKLNPTTAAHSVIPGNDIDPFGMKNKLNDPNFTKKGTPGTLDTQYNGYVLMFSVNRVGYKVDKTAGEDMFGTWSYDQFTDFLGYAAKYLSTSAKGPGIKNPLIGIYEFDMIPSSWK
jgi:hypothetical protein